MSGQKESAGQGAEAPESSSDVDRPERSAEIILSATAFDVVWQRLGLGTKPLILNVVPGVVLLEDEQQAVVRATWDRLERDGLAHCDTPDLRLEEMLVTMANASRKIDARMRLGERKVRAMAGAHGHLGVLAVLADNTVSLSAARETGLSSEITGLLPDVGAGEGSSVSLPSELLTQVGIEAGDNEAATVKSFVARGVRLDDAQEFVKITKGPRSAFGQFGLEVADRWGKLRRASAVVAWYDTPRGRYLMQRLPSGDRDYTTFSPATAKRLAQRIDELARLIKD